MPGRLKAHLTECEHVHLVLQDTLQVAPGQHPRGPCQCVCCVSVGAAGPRAYRMRAPVVSKRRGTVPDRVVAVQANALSLRERLSEYMNE